MYIKCFCGALFDKQQMKSSHYRTCSRFKNKFKDIDAKIGFQIKCYIDNLDKSSSNEYVNGLLLLQFFIKRYINLIGEKIKENTTQYQFTFNQAQNDILKNKSDIKMLDLQKSSSSKINNLHKFRNRSRDSKMNQSNLNRTQLNEIYEEIDNNSKPVYEYCQKVYQKDSNFDEDLLKAMSYSISALTTRECFLIATKNSNKLIKSSAGDENQLYNFKFNDTNLFVLLY